MCVSVFVDVFLVVIIQVDSGDAGLFQRQQFSFVNDAVSISIFPNFDFVPSFVVVVENTVVVVIKIF